MKLLPAEVKSWDGVKMRIAIPGYTDGADQFPEAEICYPLADRPADTGYKILLGDAIWIMFNGGDENSPIVMGFRNKNTGVNKDKRFLEHKNFETKAENVMKESAKTHEITATDLFTVTSGKIVFNAPVQINGSLSASGDVSIEGGFNAKGNISTEGDINATGDIHSNGSITDSDGDGGA